VESEEDSEVSLQRLLRSCEDCDLANSLSKSDSLAQLDLAVEEDIALLVCLGLVSKSFYDFFLAVLGKTCTPRSFLLSNFFNFPPEAFVQRTSRAVQTHFLVQRDKNGKSGKEKTPG